MRDAGGLLPDELLGRGEVQGWSWALGKDDMIALSRAGLMLSMNAERPGRKQRERYVGTTE